MSVLATRSEPIATISRTYLLARLAAWVGIVLRHLGPALAAAVRDRFRRRPTRTALPRRLTRVIIHLGPTFVKGGQLLSTRSDVLPPRWCAVLGRLHDRVDPMPAEEALRVLDQAYGAGGWPFEEFDRRVVASGSIACVYRARLRDGRQVAVKVRRPGIARRMRADFRLLAAGAGLGQRLPGLRRVPMRRMIDQVGAAVLQQLDLAREAEALRQLRDDLDGLIRVPEPVPEASADGVLVMEFVSRLERFGPGNFTREQRRALVKRVLQGVYRMLFIDGFVHCDMHPGNLYLDPDGGVVLLDAGFAVQLGPTVKQLFAEFFLNLATGRGDACADVVLHSAEHVPKGCDLVGFQEGIVALVKQSHGRKAGEFRLAPFATRLFDLQRRFGIAAAPEFVFPLLSLLVLEGMINELDVDVDFQAEAVPTLLKVLRH